MTSGDALGESGRPGPSPVAPLAGLGAVGGAIAGAVGGAPGMGIVGVGIDVVAVERFAASLRRTPSLSDRLFAQPELVTSSGGRRSVASLAARFAAKEAVAKALGVPAGMDWHDCRVVTEPSGRPLLRIVGTVAAAAEAQGVARWQLSLTHDAGIASAIVIALG